MILKAGVRRFVLRLAPLGGRAAPWRLRLGRARSERPDRLTVMRRSSSIRWPSCSSSWSRPSSPPSASLGGSGRPNQRAFYLPDWEYSGQLELIVWAIPLLTIMLLGGVTWIGSYDLDPARPLVSKEEPLNVQVVSLDWKWLFIYPDQHVASVNRLVIPAGTPIRFALTSGSVMTAFFVPRLGSMIYTMNRMRTQLYLAADEPGVFNGLATQISGDGFADMHFEVEAKSPQDFYAWLGQVRAGGPALTPGELYPALQTKHCAEAVHLPDGLGGAVRKDSRSDAAARTWPGRRDRPRPDRGGHSSAVRGEAELACSAS